MTHASDSIRFYFDFASPYAYFATEEISQIASTHGRIVEWRPVLLWVVLKEHGIAAPVETPAKREYLLRDMARSAAFRDLPYKQPAKLPFSSHAAARLFYAFADQDPARAEAFANRLFDALFLDGEDIADREVLTRLASELGMHPDVAAEGLVGATGRGMLEHANAEAVADGVIGSPFVVCDGEGFFGVDRLPQLRWFLSRK